jgi:hypothetical protein
MAVRELKNEGVNFLSLSPDDEIPAGVDLIITSPSELESISFPNVVAAASAAEAVREALYLKTGLKKNYRTISIGIDPGKSIGIVAIGDRRVIYEAVLGSPQEVVTSIKKIDERFNSERIRLKVGSTGDAHRNRILSRLQENFNHPIEIVDEGSTTKPKAESRRLGLHKDILAARKIALKSGKRLTQAVEVTSTPGEIKNIQRESRKKSENLTISKRLAEAVVKGEIELDEAIKLQKTKRTKDLHTT